MTIRTCINSLLATATLFCILEGTALAQRLPAYYPETFQRAGSVDDVQSNGLVVNDVPYTVSGEVVVHTLQVRETSFSQIKRGNKIGFSLGQNREIVEIWLLPNDYEMPRTRR